MPTDHIPYAGGVSPRKGGERSYSSVAAAVDFWRRADGCAEAPSRVSGTPESIEEITWGDCRAGSAVMRIALPGWGHVWPGAAATAAPARRQPAARLRRRHAAAGRSCSRFRRPARGAIAVNGRRLLLALGCWLALILPAWAAAPPAGRLIPEPIFGGQCYLVELGREHPERLLLIHGVGDEAGRSWDAILPELARRYHVLVPDLPGFGRSTKANRLYSPENYAAFIDWLLRREPEQPTIVVGHSLGGAVALAYAGRYGQNLAGLVLVDAVGVLHRVTISKDFVQKRLHFDGPFFPAGSTEASSSAWLDAWWKSSRLPGDDLDQVLASEALRETTLDGDPRADRRPGPGADRLHPVPGRGPHPDLAPLGGEGPGRARGAWRCCCRGCRPRRRAPPAPRPRPYPDGGRSGGLRQGAGHRPHHRPRSRRRDRPRRPGSASGSATARAESAFPATYRRLEISNCRDVNITDAYIGTAVIDRSLVTMTNTVIAGAATGLFIRASTLQATAVEISAATALVADQCRLDLAGVRLAGSRAAVRDEREASTLVFSVSTLISGGKKRSIHAVVVLAPGKEL